MYNRRIMPPYRAGELRFATANINLYDIYKRKYSPK